MGYYGLIRMEGELGWFTGQVASPSDKSLCKTMTRHQHMLPDPKPLLGWFPFPVTTFPHNESYYVTMTYCESCGDRGNSTSFVPMFLVTTSYVTTC